MTYKIIQKRALWLSLSGIFVGVALVAYIVFGLKPGIDFTGGSLLEVRYHGNAPTVSQATEALASLKLDSLVIQPTDKNGMIFRFQQSDQPTHQAILDKLNALETKLNPVKAKTASDKKATTTSGTLQVQQTSGQLAGAAIAVQTEGNQVVTTNQPLVEEMSFEAVGPTIGAELQSSAIWATILCILMISLYIAFAFRKVSRPVPSWQYGLATVIALFHDVFIVVGAFAILGHFYHIEVNTQTVAALLTVLGFSVHDTIVVFDRIRENLPKSDKDFEGTVNYSVNQTLVRSLNTSFTVMLVLLMIVLFGGESIRYFALALLIGIFFGTYSSIFLASPLLVIWEKMRQKRVRA